MFGDELGHSVWIRRRPDEVFAFLLHARNYVRWQAGVLDSWHSPRGRVAFGTRIHQVRDLLGQQVAGMLEIVERAPTRSAVCGVVSPLELTASYDLASEAGGTRLRANGRVPRESRMVLAAAGRAAGARRLLQAAQGRFSSERISAGS